MIRNPLTIMCNYLQSKTPHQLLKTVFIIERIQFNIEEIIIEGTLDVALQIYNTILFEKFKL